MLIERYFYRKEVETRKKVEKLRKNRTKVCNRKKIIKS